MSVGVTAVLLASVVVLVGAALQGSVGFGMSLIAAPFLVLVDPTLVPVPINVVSLVFNLLVVGRERGDAHWQAVSWPLGGLVPGAAVGAAVLTALADRRDALTIVLASLVLVAVALSAAGLHPRRRPGTLLGVGTLSGFMNTTVGIGGPPIALAFQDATGPQLRGALSRFFLVNQVTSLLLLAVWGQVHAPTSGRGWRSCRRRRSASWSRGASPGTSTGAGSAPRCSASRPPPRWWPSSGPWPADRHPAWGRVGGGRVDGRRRTRR
ncbi:MAG: sulfite exporter TauE/SafE family protein [Acidimicrobiales bacterium]